MRYTVARCLAPKCLAFWGLFHTSYHNHSSIPYVSCSPEHPPLDTFFVDQYSRMKRNASKIPQPSVVPKCDHDADIHWSKKTRQQHRMVIKQINANWVLEDRAIITPIQTPFNQEFLVAAVIDGHGGWQVAEYVQHKLPGFIQMFIEKKSQDKAEKTPLSNHEIGEAIREAFVALDADLLDKIRGSVDLGFTQVVHIGACCACLIVTPDALITANIGDSRIALRDAQGHVSWLSDLHSANELNEQQRLKKQHPGEANICLALAFLSLPTINTHPVVVYYEYLMHQWEAVPYLVIQNNKKKVVCKRSFEIRKQPQKWIDYATYWLGLLGAEIKQTSCYVKGRLQPTRSFGDFYLKFGDFSYDSHTNSSFLRNPKSFPYITAVPDIKIFPHPMKSISKKNGKPDHPPFVILGSDGVWDVLSLDEAIEIVSNELHKGVEAAGNRILENVLKKAAAQAGLSVLEMIHLRDKKRRAYYDDTTVSIIMLDQV